MLINFFWVLLVNQWKNSLTTRCLDGVESSMRRWFLSHLIKTYIWLKVVYKYLFYTYICTDGLGWTVYVENLQGSIRRSSADWFCNTCSGSWACKHRLYTSSRNQFIIHLYSKIKWSMYICRGVEWGSMELIVLSG